MAKIDAGQLRDLRREPQQRVAEMKHLDLMVAAAFVMGGSSAVYAGDARCDRPPYGGSPDRYRAILETYGGKMQSVTKTLEEICNMKFGSADRTSLHRLGYTDGEIDRTDTETLAVDAINGFKKSPASR